MEFSSDFVFDLGDFHSTSKVKLAEDHIVINSENIVNDNTKVTDNLPFHKIIEQQRSKLNILQKPIENKEKNNDEDKVVKESIQECKDIVRELVFSKKHKTKDISEENSEAFHFSEEVTSGRDFESFIQIKLCRPLLKAINEMGFVKPTPIQAACIPLALNQKDICACAKTGSGKTLAFLAPILHKLHQLSDWGAATRALILAPTRELALQIQAVAANLTRYLPRAHIQLAVGGHDRREQEAVLSRCGGAGVGRSNVFAPDIVVATPGRLIDHLHNTPGFHLNAVEFLVLDEADKMLDEYFVEQMTEIIRLCSRNRQTILLSATMTESVKELATTAIKDAVKVFINSNTAVPVGLCQEFVRIRPSTEADREAIVLCLLFRHFQTNCIVFLPTKRKCHRLNILLGLLAPPELLGEDDNRLSAEIHSDLPQVERNRALALFKAGRVRILLATDLLARGMDLEGVETVINLSAPRSHQHYIHRVGRTARAGRKGRSITLVGEEDRKLVKAIKQSAEPGSLKVRVVSPKWVRHFRDLIAAAEPHVEQVVVAERIQQELRQAQMEQKRAEAALEARQTKIKLQRDHRQNWFRERKAEKRRAEKTASKSTSKLSKKEARQVSGGDYSALLSRLDKRDAKCRPNKSDQ